STCELVTVTMNGIGEVQHVVIAEKATSGEVDPETLAAAVVEATNRAGADAKQAFANAVQQAAADMDLPGIDGLLSNLTG
ncbi:MAG: YbaB/EbfC family nucleoid-associated protein, partial [Planctomycetota bacterium]